MIKITNLCTHFSPVTDMKKSITQSDLQRGIYSPSTVSSSPGGVDQQDISRATFRNSFTRHGKAQNLSPQRMNQYGQMGMLPPHMMGMHPYIMGMANFGPYGIPDANQFNQPKIPRKLPNPGQYIQVILIRGMSL